MFANILNKITQKAWFAGLDISSSSIKLLIMSQKHGRYCVEAFDSEALPENAMFEKEIKNPALVAEVIQKLLQRCPVKVKNASVAVADSSVITKIIPMDKSLSESEIEGQILIEAERHIPYPIEEVRFDFEVLDESTEANLVDVLIAAARLETVDHYISAVTQAGLQLKVVDVESYALLRACKIIISQFQDTQSDNLTAVFDIGANRSVLTVVKNETPIFTRGDSFGGNKLVELVSQTLNISKAEAEKTIKMPNWNAHVGTKIIHDYMHDMVENIRRELQFFFSATQYDNVNLIILAGGSARLPGLAEKISELLAIKTLVANPFSSMIFGKHVNSELLLQNAPAFMQTCGLALRSFDK